MRKIFLTLATAGISMCSYAQSLPLTAGSSNPLTGDLYIDGTTGNRLIFSYGGVANNKVLLGSTYSMFGTGSKDDFATYIRDNNSYSVFINGSQRFLVSGNGYTGINTSNPQRTLDLSNSGQLTFGDDVVTDSNNGVYWHSGSGYGIYRTPGPWNGPGYQQLHLQFDTGIQLGAGTGNNAGYGKSYVEIVSGKGLMVSSGFVGIGTTTPSVPLDVFGKTRIYNALGTNDYTFTGQHNGQLRIVNGLGAAGTRALEFALLDNGTGVIQANEANVGYNNLVLNPVSGNVGIGTTTPGNKLDVNGDISALGMQAGSITAVSDPGSDTAPGLTALGVTDRGLNGQPYAWKIYTAAIGGGYGVKPNAFEVWEYPPSNMNGTCCITRFSIDKSNASSTPVNVDGNGGLALGGFGNAGNNMLAVNGAVGIGTNATPSGYKLAVAGNAIAESMTVKLQANWPDYTFKKDYKLMPLSELKTYVDKNQHLPEVPSAGQIKKNGLDLGEMNRLLMKKVEELTLYLIEKDKQDKAREQEIAELKKQVEVLTKATSNNK